jgi:hypothetical protein
VTAGRKVTVFLLLSCFNQDKLETWKKSSETLVHSPDKHRVTIRHNVGLLVCYHFPLKWQGIIKTVMFKRHTY